MPSHGSVGVTAVAPGLTGNIDAGAINTVDDRLIRGFLQGSPSNKNRLVTNPEVTSGGAEVTHPVIQQSDVDAVVAAIRADLGSQLADALAADAERLYAGPSATEVPQIVVPIDLVGTEDQASFELTGRLSFDRPYVMKADLDVAARTALEAPEGTTLLADSIEIETGAATVNGDEMTIAVTVRAAAAAEINEAAVRDLVAGKTKAEAEAALVEQGEVRIDLWPDWLDRLPRIPFRIVVETVAPSDAASPSP